MMSLNLMDKGNGKGKVDYFWTLGLRFTIMSHY